MYAAIALDVMTASSVVRPVSQPATRTPGYGHS